MHKQMRRVHHIVPDQKGFYANVSSAMALVEALRQELLLNE